ncbi:thrombospondin type 3 repeat-containing protein [Patescibacteria group bacterium]|nr:thrombospondin type 3 repeat-containing protein [Patescibacteria group bacterium]
MSKTKIGSFLKNKRVRAKFFGSVIIGMLIAIMAITVYAQQDFSVPGYEPPCVRITSSNVLDLESGTSTDDPNIDDIFYENVDGITVANISSGFYGTLLGNAGQVEPTLADCELNVALTTNSINFDSINDGDWLCIATDDNENQKFYKQYAAQSIINEDLVLCTEPVVSADDYDGDGILNSADVCPGTPLGTPVDESGCEVVIVDTDSDGIEDAIDNCPAISNTMQEDEDEDFVGDACDACFGTSPGAQVDEFGCEVAVFDGDNDGIEDSIDNCVFTANPEQEDEDIDGVGDACDDCIGTPVGTVVNEFGCEAIDADGDGVEDNIDNCPLTANPTQEDADFDFVGDVCDICAGTPEGVEVHNLVGCSIAQFAALGLEDDDSDGIPNLYDFCLGEGTAGGVDVYGCSMGTDADLDGWTVEGGDCNDNNDLINPGALEICDDGIDNDCDLLEDIDDTDCQVETDTDSDGIPDSIDNCPTNANVDQLDLDFDGQGDECDSDKDGDGYDEFDDCNDMDSTIFPNAPEICDDGIDNNCNSLEDGDDPMCQGPIDFDGDGVADSEDNCIFVSNADQDDTDSDGVGNVCDDCPGSPIGGQVNEFGCPLASGEDDDFDGIDNAFDNCPNVPNVSQADADGDAVPGITGGDACDESTTFTTQGEFEYAPLGDYFEKFFVNVYPNSEITFDNIVAGSTQVSFNQTNGSSIVTTIHVVTPDNVLVNEHSVAIPLNEGDAGTIKIDNVSHENLVNITSVGAGQPFVELSPIVNACIVNLPVNTNVTITADGPNGTNTFHSGGGQISVRCNDRSKAFLNIDDAVTYRADGDLDQWFNVQTAGEISIAGMADSVAILEQGETIQFTDTMDEFAQFDHWLSATADAGDEVVILGKSSSAFLNTGEDLLYHYDGTLNYERWKSGLIGFVDVHSDFATAVLAANEELKYSYDESTSVDRFEPLATLESVDIVGQMGGIAELETGEILDYSFSLSTNTDNYRAAQVGDFLVFKSADDSSSSVLNQDESINYSYDFATSRSFYQASTLSLIEIFGNGESNAQLEDDEGISYKHGTLDNSDIWSDVLTVNYVPIMGPKGSIAKLTNDQGITYKAGSDNWSGVVAADYIVIAGEGSSYTNLYPNDSISHDLVSDGIIRDTWAVVSTQSESGKINVYGEELSLAKLEPGEKVQYTHYPASTQDQWSAIQTNNYVDILGEDDGSLEVEVNEAARYSYNQASQSGTYIADSTVNGILLKGKGDVISMNLAENDSVSYDFNSVDDTHAIGVVISNNVVSVEGTEKSVANVSQAEAVTYNNSEGRDKWSNVVTADEQESIEINSEYGETSADLDSGEAVEYNRDDVTDSDVWSNADTEEGIEVSSFKNTTDAVVINLEEFETIEVAVAELTATTLVKAAQLIALGEPVEIFDCLEDYNISSSSVAVFIDVAGERVQVTPGESCTSITMESGDAKVATFLSGTVSAPEVTDNSVVTNLSENDTVDITANGLESTTLITNTGTGSISSYTFPSGYPQLGETVNSESYDTDPGETSSNGDGDEDGVIDVFDLCPNTPQGAEVNDQGCSESLTCSSLSGAVTYVDNGYAPACSGINPGAKKLALVDSSCNPIANARVNLRTSTSSYITYKTTNSEGIVDFSDYSGGSTPSKFEVDYMGGSYSTDHGTYDSGTGVQTKEYKLSLINSDCDPVANARINLRRENGSYVTYKKTDSSGVVNFQVVPEARMKLEADYNGATWMSAANTANMDVTLGTEGYKLYLSSSSSSPIANARVNLRRENGSYITYKKTDVDGMAKFDVLTGGSLKMEVDYNGATFMTPASISHMQQDVQTKSFGALLTENDGDPIYNARVNLRRANGSYVVYAKTNPSGVANFEVVPNAEMKLEVDYMGATFMTNAVTVTDNSQIPVQTLAYEMVFKDSNGEPIYNARINLRRANGSYVTYKKTNSFGSAIFQVVPNANMKMEVDYNGDQYMTAATEVSSNKQVSVNTYYYGAILTDVNGNPIQNARINLRRDNDSYVTYKTTDASGIAKFEVVPNAVMKLELDYNGAKWMSPANTVISNTLIPISTKNYGLKLTTNTGDPIANARVNLRRSNGSYVTYKKTDTAGVVSFPVTPGSQMKLEVDYNGGKYMTDVTTVNDDTQIDVSTNAYTMFLTSSDSTAIENARINLRTATSSYITYKKTTTDGRATFQVVPNAQMKMEVDYNGATYMTPISSITDDTEIGVQTKSYTMHLTSSNGDAIADARVNLRRASGSYVTYKKTAADGRATFEVVPNAQMKLEVDYMGATHMTAVSTITNNTEVGVQTKAYSLLLNSSEGDVIADARVNLRRASGSYVTYKKTAADGRATFQVVPNAQMKLEVDYMGATHMTEANTVTNNTEIGVQTKAYSLIFSDSNNDQIAGARVNLRRDNGSYVTYKTTDVSGIAKFEVVPNANMKMEIDYHGGKYMTLSSVVSSNTNVPVQSVAIKANILATGLPLDNQRVDLYNSASSYVLYQKTGVDGSTTFQVLPIAEHKIRSIYGGVTWFSPLTTGPTEITHDF